MLCCVIVILFHENVFYPHNNKNIHIVIMFHWLFLCGCQNKEKSFLPSKYFDRISTTTVTTTETMIIRPSDKLQQLEVFQYHH